MVRVMKLQRYLAMNQRPGSLPQGKISIHAFALSTPLALRTIQRIVDGDVGRYGFSQWVVECVKIATSPTGRARDGLVQYDDFPRPRALGRR